MNVVDSSGWLEYFGDGPNAAFFSQAIEEKSDLVVPAISLFEVYKRMHLQRGKELALEAAAQMQQGKVVALDAELAIWAAEISLELKLPMADSIILATARAYNAILWTQDEHFSGIEGVKYFAKALGTR